MGSAGLSETAADGAGGSALGKRGSVASGAGRQPNRRRVFRIIFSSRPIRPAIPRLLRPWALRRKMIRSRGAILERVVGVGDAMDENHALFCFGLEGNTVIHKHHLRGGNKAGEQITLIWG